MTIVYFLLPFALLLGFLFLGAFLWAAKSGQFDDLVTPAHSMLIDNKNENGGNDV